MAQAARARAVSEALVACRYHLISLLGDGGHATVWRAYDSRLDLEVALKIAKPGIEGSVDRLRREAMIASRLTSPHVIRFYDSAESDGTCYLAMELLQGCSLRELLRRQRVILPQRAKILLAQICQALITVHRAGFLHRDIKPENLFISSDDHIHLLDFGLATSLTTRSNLTLDSHLVGTPGYLPPESHDIDLEDERRDVFALGLVIREMLTGLSPSQEVTARGAGLDQCPPDLKSITERCLAPVEERYCDVSEVAAALFESSDSLTRPARTRSKSGPVLAFGALTLVAAGGFLFVRARGSAIPVHDPVKAATFCEAGVNDLSSRRFDRARENFKSGLAMDSGQRSCLYSLTELNVTQFASSNDPRYLREAEATADSLRRIDAASTTTLMARAMVLIEQRRLHDALPFVQKAVSQSPDLPDAQLLMAGYHYYSGTLADGLRAADRAVDLAPGHAKSHQVRALLLRAMNRNAEAESEYRAALKINPEYDKALLNLGSLLLASGRFKDALEAFDRALLQGDSVEGYIGQVQSYFYSGSYRLASRVAEKALALYPNSEVLHGLRAEALTCDERSVDAAAEYASAIERAASDVNNPRTITRLVRYHARLGNISTGKALLAKAKEMRGVETARILYAEAILAACERNFTEAARLWEVSLKSGYPFAAAIADPIWSEAMRSEVFKRAVASNAKAGRPAR